MGGASVILGCALVVVLTYGVLTLWVRERWAVGVLQAAVFLLTAVTLVRDLRRRERLAAPFAVLPLLGMCFWGVVQRAAHWTAVPSATEESVLYWLTAAAVVWLAHRCSRDEAERQAFLRLAVAVGSAICVLGTVQLFTEPGKVFWLFASGYDDRVVGPFLSPNNYAAFVELLFPATLAQGLRSKSSGWRYLVLAAALFASVIAVGSRAGALFVAVEAIVIVCLYRQKKLAIGFLVLASAFTAVAGHDYLWNRIERDHDPLSYRREFLESSLAMVRAEPLHGFGLGAWTAVYPQFAVIDPGLAVNHAHNEWVEWAAEGGLPALALMFALAACCLRPAWNSVWGLGLLAVFLHALVDYPFLRLGLALWVFAWVGSLKWKPQVSPTVGAAAAVAVLLAATAATLRLTWADSLYQRATLASVERAAEIAPGRADYHFVLAQLDPEHAVAHLQQALAANPYHGKALLRLAAERESRGRVAEAEHLLLESARRDRRYAPAWALANFYFRTDRSDAFWRWARQAAGTAYGDLTPLLDLCFALSPDALTVRERLSSSHAVERALLSYLSARHDLDQADRIAEHLAAEAIADDRAPLLNYIDGSIDAGRTDGAAKAWQYMVRRSLVAGPSTSNDVLMNGAFLRPATGRGFDWRLGIGEGYEAQREAEPPAAVVVALSGSQPEVCELLSQVVAHAGENRYRLRFEYLASGLPDETGIHWQAGSLTSPVLKAAAGWTELTWSFRAESQVMRLRLVYRRVLGTTRSEGQFRLRKVCLEPEHPEVLAHNIR